MYDNFLIVWWMFSLVSCMFQSVIIVSRYPFINLFTELCGLIAPEFFHCGHSSVEAACQDIDKWPPPIPGGTLNLPILGTVLQVSVLVLSVHYSLLLLFMVQSSYRKFNNSFFYEWFGFVSLNIRDINK